MNHDTPDILKAILPIDKSIASIVEGMKENTGIGQLPRTSVEKYLGESQTLTRYICGSEEKRRNSRTGIPWELTPAVYSFLSAKESCWNINDLDEKRREFEKHYFNKIKQVEETYFSIKRDVNASYQAFSADEVCMRPLIDRINSIYILSRAGDVIKRPNIMLTLLRGLETLINDVICNSISDYSKALSIHEEDDLPFKGLVDSLVDGRRLEGNKEALSKIGTLVKAINRGKKNKGFSSQEQVSTIEGHFKKYLESTLTDEEHEHATVFRNSIINIKNYLELRRNDIQETEKQARNILREYVTKIIRHSDSENIELNLQDVPPDDLLLIDRLKERQAQVSKVALPYAMHWAMSCGINYMGKGSIDKFLYNHLCVMWNRSVDICEYLGIKVWALTPTEAYSDDIRNQDEVTFKERIAPRLLFEDGGIDSPLLTEALEGTYVYVCDYIARAYVTHNWSETYRINIDDEEDKKIKKFCILYRWLIEARLSAEADKAATKIASEITAQREFKEWIAQQDEHKRLCNEMNKIFII